SPRAGSAAPTTSPRRRSSSRATARATSPGPCCPSTAASAWVTDNQKEDMGILEGKNVLVTRVTMNYSIADATAESAQRAGANVGVSAAGRAVSLARRVVARMEQPLPLVELDVTDPEHLANLPETLGEHLEGGLDGIVHSIAFADPAKALGGAFLSTDW